VAQAAGDPAEAARRYQQALAITERLAQADPANAAYQRDLSVSYNRLGDLTAGGADPDGSARIYRQALEFSQRLYGADHPLTASIRNRLQEPAGSGG
jgi:hypothetical protein